MRIYPTFLVVLSLSLCAMLLFPSASKLSGCAAHDAFYIMGNVLLLPGVFSIIPIVTVSWSLSYEMLFYLVMPALRLTLRLDRWLPRQRVILAIVLATAMIVSGMMGLGPNYAMIMFPAGMILYECGDRFGATRLPGRDSRCVDFLALALVSATLFAISFGEEMIGLKTYIGIHHQNAVNKIGLALTFSLLVYRCLFNRNAAYSIFSWRPLRWLGNISYSFYLFHGFVLHGLFRSLNALLPNYQVGLMGYLLLLPPSLFVTVVLTWPLFAYVEKPTSLTQAPAFAAPERKVGSICAPNGGLWSKLTLSLACYFRPSKSILFEPMAEKETAAQ
jgi:peptidoglycan/LPS O-acetylase OafA/YrhL